MRIQIIGYLERSCLVCRGGFFFSSNFGASLEVQLKRLNTRPQLFSVGVEVRVLRLFSQRFMEFSSILKHIYN